MLPTDVVMLVSYLNTLLRDDDMPLNILLETRTSNVEEVLNKLHDYNYIYDEDINQIKKR